jgi:hypothetical protein
MLTLASAMPELRPLPKRLYLARSQLRYRVGRLTRISPTPPLPLLADQLATLAELDHMLRQHDLAYWLFGGWAVEFHLGRVTREHADIDIAVWAHDHDRLAALLYAAAWQHRPERGEDGYTCYERGSVRLELAFLERDEHGEVYTPLQAGRGGWPADSFGNALAELEGVQVSLVSREALIADKSVQRPDGATAAKDRADVAQLLNSK